MIVPMRKIFVACRGSERQQFLDALASLGVVHVVPIDPAKADVDDQLASGLAAIERALQVLADITPAGAPADLPPREVAEKVLELQRRQAECESRLTALYRQLETVQSLWGELRLDQLETLRRAGVEIGFCSIPSDEVSAIQGDCVHPLHKLGGRRILVAVVSRNGSPELPDTAEPIPLPSRDAAGIRAEAAELDAQRKQAAGQLAALAAHVPALEAERERLQEKALFDRTLKSGLNSDPLFAVQGWVPAEQADDLAERLAATGINAAVELSEPSPDEQPPTLLRPPAWARPIQGLLETLGTVSGYREFDVSVPFMLALPIFAAMLISDGGYGAILLFGPLAFYKKVSRTLGAQFTQLIMVVGATSLVWGFICATFFGVTLYPPLIEVGLSDQARWLLMKISFVMGGIHLSVAQLWQAVRYWPDQRFLNKVGWTLFIWGVFGLVGFFVLNVPVGRRTHVLLILGFLLIVLFAEPARNPLKRLGWGLASFPLSALSAFSDIISYVRLMAVGLASSVLATSFNEMAWEAGFLPLTVVVLIFGHGLNLGLAMIALFAHGVRLNMLEFSNNLGMQWTGYRYAPFVTRALQEN